MISVAMIVNEEVNTLRRAIESVRPYVTEVVVGVDVASTDGTREIAVQFADVVIDIHLSEELAKRGPVGHSSDWGFSKARNMVLDACHPENWRLTLDGHEIVGNPGEMASEIGKAALLGCDGIEVMLEFEPGEDGIPQLMYMQGRLLAPTVRYNGAQHNVPMISRPYSSSAFHIVHLKRDQAVESREKRNLQRSGANIDGFLAEVKANPSNPRPRFYLGQAYRESGMWADAITAYAGYLKVSTWKEERWHARTSMATCLLAVGDVSEARDQLSMAIEEFPEHAEAYYRLGFMAYGMQRFREAQLWLEKACEMPMPQCRLFLNPRVYLVERYDQLSMVYHHLGRFEDAIEYATKALNGGKNERISSNIEFWKRKLGA